MTQPGARAARLADAALRRAEWSERASYLPLDVPKPVADGIWVVDGAPIYPLPLPLPLPLRMTVIRLPDGGLLLHSPTQYGAGLAAALRALGPVSDIVAPSFAHWTTLQPWQAAFPNARLWGAPNLRQRLPVRRARLRWDGEITPTLPMPWQTVLEHVILPGAMGFREVAFLHTPSRTAILTDLVVNLEAGRLSPAMRSVARAAGMVEPDSRTSPIVRLVVRAGGPAAVQAAQRILAWAPARVIFAHGKWFDQDATAALRHSLRWLLPG